MTQVDVDYHIEIRPALGRVCAHVNGVPVADSTDVLIMHETGLAPNCYFPKNSLGDGLLEPSSFRTFCPFKGTATHWHLNLPNRRIENAAWSYEIPLPEAAAVAGRVAFYPRVIDSMLAEPPLPDVTPTPIAGGPFDDWLLRKAWLCRTAAELTEQFSKRLIDDGVPLWRLTVSIWTLHPELVGQQFTWLRDEDRVEVSDTPHGALQQPAYLNSPVRHVSEGLGGVRQRLDGETPDFAFPILDELRAHNGTDYVAMPLPFSNGQIQTLSLASDHPDGFSTAGLGRIFASVFALARFYEVLTVRSDTAVLLDTYLGSRTGRLVLGGQTHRGAGENIRAAIVMCDLRDSTVLTEALGRDAYLNLLNDFFERAASPILAQGGEILKFIGDAVLAIFPVEEEVGGSDDAARRACVRACEAACQILDGLAAAPRQSGQPAMRCAIGLHVGEVMYGNVGAPTRLDFTVIGTAANVAARLSTLCKTLDRDLLVSADVATHVADGLVSLGKHRLRHVENEVEVFTVARSA